MTAPPSTSAAYREASNREIKRRLHGRAEALLRGLAIPRDGWAIRTAVASIMANHIEPTDEQMVEQLMRAHTFPKPRRRHWRIGEAGWRTRS